MPQKYYCYREGNSHYLVYPIDLYLLTHSTLVSLEGNVFYISQTDHISIFTLKPPNELGQ